MACVNVHCPRCDPTLVYRHGQTPKDLVRFHCRECRSVFQLTYKSGVKEQIVDIVFKGAGVKDETFFTALSALVNDCRNFSWDRT
ncbi:MAG: IS1 family transposase [Serratia symbiotica]|nr:IS1 family transposase [Serratia symbiotica]